MVKFGKSIFYFIKVWYDSYNIYAYSVNLIEFYT